MSAQFYNQNKSSYPELQDFDHAMRHYHHTDEPITDILMKKFQNKYAVREFMLRRPHPQQQNRYQLGKLAESNLFMEYELKKIKQPFENLYAESNKRYQVNPMVETVYKILNDDQYYNN